MARKNTAICVVAQHSSSATQNFSSVSLGEGTTHFYQKLTLQQSASICYCVAVCELELSSCNLIFNYNNLPPIISNHYTDQ